MCIHTCYRRPVYTHLCIYAYANMYIDMHGHILCVCIYINAHIANIPV